MLLPTPHIQVTAAQAMRALIQVITDIVITAVLMYLHLSDSTERVKTAQPVPINLPILLIQARAAQATVVPTLAQPDIVITVVLMLLYPPVNTEAEKTAPRAAMLPLTQLIPVTAVRQTAVLTQVTAATAITAAPM